MKSEMHGTYPTKARESFLKHMRHGKLKRSQSCKEIRVKEKDSVVVDKGGTIAWYINHGNGNMKKHKWL
jgi:hypothetical protein